MFWKIMFLLVLIVLLCNSIEYVRERSSSRFREARRIDGFDYAQQALKNGSETVESLQQHVQEARDFNHFYSFDQGVVDYLNFIVRMEDSDRENTIP